MKKSKKKIDPRIWLEHWAKATEARAVELRAIGQSKAADLMDRAADQIRNT